MTSLREGGRFGASYRGLVTVHADRHCCDRSGKIYRGVSGLFHGRAIWRVILAMLYSHLPCRLSAGSQVMDSPPMAGERKHLWASGIRWAGQATALHPCNAGV